MTDVSPNFAKHLSSLPVISHSKLWGLLSLSGAHPLSHICSMDSTIWQSFSLLKVPLLQWTKIIYHCLVEEVVKERWGVSITSLDVFNPLSLSKTILFFWPNSLKLLVIQTPWDFSFLEKNNKWMLISVLRLWFLTCFRLGPWKSLAATGFCECCFLDLKRGRGTEGATLYKVGHGMLSVSC